MKKISFCFFVSLLSVMNCFAQERFSGDVIVDNQPVYTQRNARVCTAWNGDIYVGFTYDSLGTPGYKIMKSTDGGFSFQFFGHYVWFPGNNITCFDMSVLGNSNSTFRLLVAVADRTNANACYFDLDVFDTTATFPIISLCDNQVYNDPVGYHAAAVDNDYTHHSSLENKYSIGLILAKNGVHDSLMFISFIDTVFTDAPYNLGRVYNTANKIRTVDISYGRSSTQNQGGYWYAWDEFANNTTQLGDVLASWEKVDSQFVFNAARNISNLGLNTAGKSRQPRISCQSMSGDNASGSFDVVLSLNSTLSPTTHEITTFYSLRGDSLNSTFGNIVQGIAGHNNLQGDVSYEENGNNFLISYYDSTSGKLPYLSQSATNLGTAWNIIQANYNDDTTNLKNAFPNISIDPVIHKPDFVWNAVSGSNGVTMFDEEAHNSSVQNFNGEKIELNLLPNPVSDILQMKIETENEENALVLFVNMLGQIISSSKLDLQEGQTVYSFDVKNFPAGIYVVEFSSKNSLIKKQFVVNR